MAKPDTQYISENGDSWVLSGKWTLNHIAIIERQASKLAGKTPTYVDASGLQALDPSGAWLMLYLFKDANVTWDTLSDEHNKLLEIISSAEILATPEEKKLPLGVKLFTAIGKNAAYLAHESFEFISFVGQVAVKLVQAFVKPGQLRFVSIVRHIEDTGVRAIPIVALIAFLISIVLAYQSITQLRLYGGEIFTVNLVTLSVLREMGVLLTAIMVAGRSGSAFTAEIGVMQVNEEIDALQVMKLDPFQILVLPRLIALLIALPLLTFIANITGLLGAYVTTYFIMDLSWQQFLTQVKAAAKFQHFFVGMVKAPFFAILIACVGCRRGLQVKGSAESVGKLTTVSVVESIFLVLLVDALFSIFFSQINL